jgi:zinc transport system ATP-binding protein
MSLIETRGVGIDLGGRPVLRDVDFAIERSEIVTVVGPNGSGKSTFLRILVGALAPDRGRVTRRPGLKIGHVPQRLSIDPTLPLSVGRMLGLPRRQPAAIVAAALDRVGLPMLADRPVAQLSGGQLQRVLLARALLGGPDILILDEPTQNLDQPATAAFYLLIEEVRRDTGCAVLMVSHDLHVVMSASDRVICLNGHVCCQGTPVVVSAAPEYRALFGTGTQGAFALYRHAHDHRHDHAHDHAHGHDHHHGHAPEKEGAAP